jgi:epoxyqueuosine reductase
LSGGALKRAFVERAKALGFDTIRIAKPDAIPLAPDRLQAWLAAGHHGSMDWMAETAERRADPRILWPEVRSVILLGLNYGPAENPLAELTR